MSEFILQSTYKFHFKTKEPSPISEIIETLEGLNDILQSIPKVTKKLTGFEDFQCKIEIEKLESGSIWEDIVIKYIFKSKTDHDQFIEKVREIVPPKKLLPFLVAGLIGYSIHWLIVSDSTANATANTIPQPTTNINISNVQDSFININGTQIPNEIKDAVVDSVKNKKEMAASAAKFLRPAKSQPHSEIVMESVNNPDINFNISSDTINKSPDKYEPKQDHTETDLTNVKLIIRATDKDSTESGWAGSVEGITGRTKIVFNPEIDVEKISKLDYVSADVTITSSVSKIGGSPRPLEIYVNKIYQSE